MVQVQTIASFNNFGIQHQDGLVTSTSEEPGQRLPQRLFHGGWNALTCFWSIRSTNLSITHIGTGVAGNLQTPLKVLVDIVPHGPSLSLGQVAASISSYAEAMLVSGTCHILMTGLAGLLLAATPPSKLSPTRFPGVPTTLTCLRGGRTLPYYTRAMTVRRTLGHQRKDLRWLARVFEGHQRL